MKITIEEMIKVLFVPALGSVAIAFIFHLIKAISNFKNRKEPKIRKSFKDSCQYVGIFSVMLIAMVFAVVTGTV